MRPGFFNAPKARGRDLINKNSDETPIDHDRTFVCFVTAPH
ncbi:hypothetical protein HMP0721_1540 [Pseudoramibacter alactolyticus ATCC 23263]|uniref:Uncharacterized protein n=1 Tax=Pseudoramibacter alactolyticus ATCC 23263 TaxID=887929 RepID=E6MHQ5_9FIRM|nr:hypothetical protein HMP0721_1540 [Pseudoramibacter alactolyticus ATCC 23263]